MLLDRFKNRHDGHNSTALGQHPNKHLRKSQILA
jgi:hypothetical protein